MGSKIEIVDNYYYETRSFFDVNEEIKGTKTIDLLLNNSIIDMKNEFYCESCKEYCSVKIRYGCIDCMMLDPLDHNVSESCESNDRIDKYEDLLNPSFFCSRKIYVFNYDNHPGVVYEEANFSCTEKIFKICWKLKHESFYVGLYCGNCRNEFRRINFDDSNFKTDLLNLLRDIELGPCKMYQNMKEISNINLNHHKDKDYDDKVDDLYIYIDEKLEQNENDPYKIIIDVRKRNTELEIFYKFIDSNYEDIEDFLYSNIKIEYKRNNNITTGTGALKQFYTNVIIQFCKEKYFIKSGSNDSLYFGKTIYKFNCEELNPYRFLGFVLAKCIIDKVQIPINLSQVIYKLLINSPTFLTDLKYSDIESYNRAIYIINHDVEDLEEDIYFEVTENDEFEDIHTHFLLDGEDEDYCTKVTNINKFKYINILFRYLLTKRTLDKIDFFMCAFTRILSTNILNMFKPMELEILLCGNFIDKEDFLNNISINKRDKDNKIICTFFDIVNELSEDNFVKLYYCITGMTRTPSGGINEFENKIRIKLIKSKQIKFITCHNTMLIPENIDLDTFKDTFIGLIQGSDFNAK